MLLELAHEEGFIARKPHDGKPYFVAALLRMAGEQRRRKEEAGPSPIRASRVWAQDDNEKQRRRQERQKTGAYKTKLGVLETAKTDPYKAKGRAPETATTTPPKLQRRHPRNCDDTPETATAPASEILTAIATELRRRHP